jgi:hypothetical protein
VLAPPRSEHKDPRMLIGDGGAAARGIRVKRACRGGRVAGPVRLRSRQ